MIQGLDFISIPIRSMDEAIAFYRDRLGFRLITQSDRWSELEMADGCTLSLYPPESYGESFTPVTALSLRVEDPERTAKTLAAQGVTFPHGTTPHDSGVCLGVPFLDPAGNRLHLHRRYAPEV